MDLLEFMETESLILSLILTNLNNFWSSQGARSFSCKNPHLTASPFPICGNLLENWHLKSFNLFHWVQLLNLVFLPSSLISYCFKCKEAVVASYISGAHERRGAHRIVNCIGDSHALWSIFWISPRYLNDLITNHLSGLENRGSAEVNEMGSWTKKYAEILIVLAQHLAYHSTY